MKRHLITLLKVVISLGIIAYLVWDAQKKGDVFTNLRDQSKDWAYLGLAIGFCFSAVLLTMIRWHFLLRALEIPTKFTNSLRIAFVGYLFNLAPLGIAGGDLVRIMMVAGQHKNIKAKSLASVALDRVIGLYMLFVVASVAIFATGFHHTDDEMIRKVCEATWIIAIVGGIGAAILMIPAVTEGRFATSLEKLPAVGKAFASLLEAMRMYRRRPGVLLLAAILTIGVHSCFAIGVYMIARGLPGHDHSLGTHMIIMPLSASAGAIPLSFGPFEAMLDYFYLHIPLAVGSIMAGQGLVVALGYRVITVMIASIGAICYFSSRLEVSRALDEAKTVQEETQSEESSLNDSPLKGGCDAALNQDQSAA